MADVLTKDNAVDRWSKFAPKKASERAVQGVCMGIYGQGGAGKTLLASELRLLGKTALLDAESGTDVLTHLQDDPNLDIFDVSNFKRYQQLIEEFKKDHTPYENIIVDNLSEIMDMGEAHFGIVGNGSHDLQNYKLLTREMIRRVKDLRELSRQHGINVVFLCWDADEKDDRNVLKKDLALTPALRKEYPGIINIIGHVRVTRNPDLRILDFAPSPKTVAKFRRSPTSSAMEVPFEITYDVKNLPIVDVIETIKKGVKWPSEKYNKKAGENEQ